MKNLKQVLALGMAFSLSLSTLASAAFTDQDSISKENAAAVELLTTLDIIQGYEDGSFKPENTVTRAQMAKMIYTIRNGGNDNADAYKTVSTSFDDIQGHWAEGYIKYLQNTDIVAGKSPTKFRPDQTVTTAEAMKMALVLGGYRPDKAGLEGAEWLNNTVSLATTNKLTKDVVSPMAGACTRQDAAQILANALGMTAVQWNEFVGGFVNDSDDGLAIGGEKITVGYKWMDLTTYVGRLEASGDLSIDGSGAGNNQFRVNISTKNDKKYEGSGNGGVANNNNNDITFKDGKDHTDLVGQEVKVLTGDKIDEVYGVYPTGTSQVVDTTMDKVEVDLDNEKLKVDGNKYSISKNVSSNTASGTDVYVDLEQKANVKSAFGDYGKIASDKVKMIDWDNDGKYETIFVNTANVAKVTYVGTDSITVGRVGGSRGTDLVKDNRTFENSEISTYDGVAKGDYVVITKDDYNEDKWNIEKATVVEGKVDGVVNNERKVRVDGTWYQLANDKTGKPYGLIAVPGTVSEFANKDEITLYVVGDVAYYVESKKGNDANRSVAMVYDISIDNNDDEWGGAINKAKIILADGTKKTVNVAKEGNSVEKSDLERGMIYEYIVNNDGDYIFNKLDSKNTAGYDAYDVDSDGMGSDKTYGSKVIADDAVVFAYIKDKKDAEVYTGKQIKDVGSAGYGNKWDTASDDNIADTGVVLSDTSNGFTYARMMSMAIDKKLNNTTNYGYLITDGTYAYSDEVGAYAMEYSYWNGSEVVNAVEKTSSYKRWATKGTIISFNKADGNVIKDVTDVEGLDVDDNDKLYYASMTGVDGKYVALSNKDGGTVNLEVNSDSLFYYVNSDASKDENIGVKGEGYDYPVSNGNINVAYVKTTDGKVKFMVIDVDGKLIDGKIVGNGATDSDIEGALGDGDVTISGGTNITDLKVPADRTLVIDGDLTVKAPTAKATTDKLVVEGKLVVNGKLTIESRATLTIAKDAKVEATGSLDNKGTIDGDGKDNIVYDNSSDSYVRKVTK